MWLKEVDHYANSYCNKLLVGNKDDLLQKRAVSFETAKAFADSLNITYIETSAKKDSNVDFVFLSMAKEIKEKIAKQFEKARVDIVKPHEVSLKEDNCC